jgi:hypothetical protein
VVQPRDPGGGGARSAARGPSCGPAPAGTACWLLRRRSLAPLAEASTGALALKPSRPQPHYNRTVAAPQGSSSTFSEFVASTLLGLQGAGLGWEADARAGLLAGR